MSIRFNIATMIDDATIAIIAEIATTAAIIVGTTVTIIGTAVPMLGLSSAAWLRAPLSVVRLPTLATDHMAAATASGARTDIGPIAHRITLTCRAPASGRSAVHLIDAGQM